VTGGLEITIPAVGGIQSASMVVTDQDIPAADGILAASGITAAAGCKAHASQDPTHGKAAGRLG
jgi:hypothetical protein